MRILILLSFFPMLTLAQTAEIVFTNANVWTVDSSKPRAEAVAVTNGKILAVGSKHDIAAYISPKTVIVDLKGKFMLPGFIDDHTHFMSGGFQLQSVNLRYADDEQEFARLIKERAKQFPLRWITGGDWDHDRWKGGRLPTRQLIDAAT